MNIASVLHSQLDAAMQMLEECIDRCPPEAWDALVAKYPFWAVAYHALCYADIYVLTDDTWKPHGTFHPAGRAELEEEYPSRVFSRDELLVYAAFCRVQARERVPKESEVRLAGESGFPRHRFSRAELHVYNARHIQHHVGQLSAVVRRAGQELSWVKVGKA